MNIEKIDVSAYTVPTEQPEADGTLAWTRTTLVLVEAYGGGQTGLGWTYGPAAAASIAAEQLARRALGRSILDVPGVHEAMCRAVRNAGRPGVCSLAISAVDCALWDLKARVLELPLHRLLGTVCEEVPVYGSGGFTTYDDTVLREQLLGWVHTLGIPRVKIKIGESWGEREQRDLERMRLARQVIGDDAELYADANGGYTVKQAVRVGRQAEALDLRWFEEPVSSDDLAGLRTVTKALPVEVAAGEYGFDLPYFARMVPAVDCLQADVTRCGGITEFLRVAALARADNTDISAHCAPNQHTAVMAAIPNARHIEWFHDHVRIENLLFDGTLTPKAGTVRPHDTPGNGVALKHADVDSLRVYQSEWTR